MGNLGQHYYQWRYVETGGTPPTTTPVPAVQTVDALIHNFAFAPETLNVKVGTKVIWTNKDMDGHTVTSDKGAFSSPLIRFMQSYSFTFTQPGTYTYHCGPHPFMTGTVIVS